MEVVKPFSADEKLFPNGAWDVHHHIFDPSKFTYAEDRHLTPPPATISQFLDFKTKLGITHSILTHGLSYGDDCSSLKSFVTELGHDSTHGVAVIDPITVTASELKSMHAAGIRGIRVNLYKYGAMHDLERQKIALRDHARIIKAHCPGWSMAFTHVHPGFWSELRPVIEKDISAQGIQLVTDHFALLKGVSMLPPRYKDDVTKQPGFQEILELVRSGCLWVKISAPYRVSELQPTYEDLKPIVCALVKANPKRLLWGSDWPHTPRMKVRNRAEALAETPFLEVDDLAWLRSLRAWVSEEEWHQIMVSNPKALYAS